MQQQHIKLGILKFGIHKIGCSMSWTRYYLRYFHLVFWGELKTPIVFPFEIFWPFTQVDPIICVEKLGSESQDGGNSVIDDSNNKISIDLEKESNQVAPFCAESEILLPSNENEESFLTLVPSRYSIHISHWWFMVD